MTQVFIGWSGPRSRAVAKALHDWLKSVLQASRPWMSDKDIALGTVWFQEITSALEASKVGIICLTPENAKQPWIYFESGALSKAMGKSHVIPYLVGMNANDLDGPLFQLQGTEAHEEGTLRIIETINGTLAEPLTSDILKMTFSRAWPELKVKLEEIKKMAGGDAPTPRRAEELLAEVLPLIRTMSIEQGEILKQVVESRQHQLAKDGRVVYLDPTNLPRKMLFGSIQGLPPSVFITEPPKQLESPKSSSEKGPKPGGA